MSNSKDVKRRLLGHMRKSFSLFWRLLIFKKKMSKIKKNAQFDEDSFSEDDDFPFEDDEDNDFSGDDRIENHDDSSKAEVKPNLSKHLLKLQETLGRLLFSILSCKILQFQFLFRIRRL